MILNDLFKRQCVHAEQKEAKNGALRDITTQLGPQDAQSLRKSSVAEV